MESILEKFDLSGELSGAGGGSWQKCHEGEILAGDGFGSGNYVTPCICEAGADFSIVRQEIFAPLTGRARCPWRRGSNSIGRFSIHPPSLKLPSSLKLRRDKSARYARFKGSGLRVQKRRIS